MKYKEVLTEEEMKTVERIGKELQAMPMMGFKREGLLNLKYTPTLETIALLKALVITEEMCSEDLESVMVNERYAYEVSYQIIMEEYFKAIRYSSRLYKKNIKSLQKLGLIYLHVTVFGTYFYTTDLTRLLYVGEEY